MADYEQGDYNWSDDIGTDDSVFGLEERYESLTYEQMVRGYEDEETLIDAPANPSKSSISTLLISESSLHTLYEYLISTNQSCFFIKYDAKILASGFINKQNDNYNLSVHVDDNIFLVTQDIRGAVDAALCNVGNTPLSFRQSPLDYVYIAGCHKSWSNILNQITS
jgi:hypothetical protein